MLKTEKFENLTIPEVVNTTKDALERIYSSVSLISIDPDYALSDYMSTQRRQNLIADITALSYGLDVIFMSEIKHFDENTRDVEITLSKVNHGLLAFNQLKQSVAAYSSTSSFPEPIYENSEPYGFFRKILHTFSNLFIEEPLENKLKVSLIQKFLLKRFILPYAKKVEDLCSTANVKKSFSEWSKDMHIREQVDNLSRYTFISK